MYIYVYTFMYTCVCVRTTHHYISSDAAASRTPPERPESQQLELDLCIAARRS